MKKCARELGMDTFSPDMMRVIDILEKGNYSFMHHQKLSGDTDRSHKQKVLEVLSVVYASEEVIVHCSEACLAREFCTCSKCKYTIRSSMLN